MTGLANFLFASLLASRTAAGISVPNPAIAVRPNDQKPPNPQAAAQGPQQSPAKPAPPRPNPDTYGIYHVGNGVTSPKVIYSVEPELADKLRKKKINASCVVGLTVDTDGNPKDVHVISSIPSLEDKKLHRAVMELHENCIRPVKQYRFEPATLQGRPVPVELKVEMKFQLY
jgi:Gram-negative bacterial TonB protein C-terminal